MQTTADRLTVFFLTFSILTALILPVSALLPTPEDAAVYDRIIRLHVLANSDAAEDQAQKLRVRDGVLAEVSHLLAGVKDRAEAEAILRENLPAVEAAAEAVLRAEGSPDAVRVTLTEEVYPTRIYGDVTLPAGRYTSLRILLGEAEGKNWWCVLFPQLCLMGTPDEELMIEAGLTPSQIRLITGDSPDVVIRFRLLEWISSIFSGYSA